MTVVELERGARPRRLRSVELARRTEVDTWALADAVYADVLDELPDEQKNTHVLLGVKTGLRAAEDVVAAAHEKAGTDLARSYLHNLFVTARSWPVEDRRPDLAGFAAHYELRGQEYRNRVAVLERIAAKSRTGRASRQAVLVWRSERKPPAHRSFLELVERRLRGSLKAAGKPWHTVAEGDREAIARILRTIASEVESGTFPD